MKLIASAPEKNQPVGRWAIVVLVLTLSLNGLACDREKEAATAPQATTPAVSASSAAAVESSSSADAGPPPSFNSTRAMQYVKEIVALGPRPIGSANHKKVENYISSHLKGDLVEDDSFTIDTTEGKFPVHNIIAKYPGTRDGIIIIASHYDTNFPLRNTAYIGANDGASSSALLLEIANQYEASSGTATACGYYGTTRKNPCGFPGTTLRAYTECVTSRTSGRKMGL